MIEFPVGRLDRMVSSLWIGGGRLFSTLLPVMLSVAVLINGVRIAWSVMVTRFDYVW